MIIQGIDIVLGDVRITSDEYNYVISLRKTFQAGKNVGTDYWTAKSYHNNLYSVAEAVLSLNQPNISVSDVNVLKTFYSQIKELAGTLAKQIEESQK